MKTLAHDVVFSKQPSSLGRHARSLERTVLLVRKFRQLRQRATLLRDRYARVCYSQEGEDVILARLLEQTPPGVYVDVGAHHPSRFSNTKLLYDSGWRGLNIDALPGSMNRFRRCRPRDVNLEMGVGEVSGQAIYWQFLEPALSTFDREVANGRLLEGHELVREVVLPVEKLSTLVDRHLGATRLDLLTVDVEGRDLAVLRSLDWQRHRPAVVCVESEAAICDMSSGPAGFLVDQGYKLYAATGLTRIFRLAT